MTPNTLHRVAQLHRDALIWDNHVCLPFQQTEDWLPQLRRYAAAGFTVISINIGDGRISLESQIRMAAKIRDFVARHPGQYSIASTVADIHAAKHAGRLAIAFDVEGLYGMGEELSLIRLYYDLGVRWMLFAYNTKNLAGYGCHDQVDHGLTELGHQVVAEMERVGMVKCCSHTGYRTALDVIEAGQQPTIFSHSNAHALYPHPRNIPDELMTACAARGGVVCLNGVGIFLGNNTADAEALARHIDYVVDLIGIDHVGLGLDYVFDQQELDRTLRESRDIWPEMHGYRPGIKFFCPEQLPELTERLLKLGYSDSEIFGILGANLLRVAEAVWK